MKLFDPHDHIRVTKNRLPHWQQNGAVYFITFRLGDALPRNLLERWKEERNAWLKWHPLPWSADMEREYHRRFSRRIEEWLDANHGSCICAAIGARKRSRRRSIISTELALTSSRSS